MGEPDVLDTWATSSLTPQIACGWERDDDLFARTFPMDLHAQAHEIIRTWLFSCVLRTHLEHGTLPWRRTAISGFVVDPDRKKMSKSSGNVTTPVGVLERYGADAVRWRAARTRLGTDTPFDEAQMRVGRRLATKMLNAGRFVFGVHRGAPVRAAYRPAHSHAPYEPLDLAMLAEVARVVRTATDALDAYDHTTALAVTERFFWTFCDDYLELVKERAYGDRGPDGAASAREALALGLSVLARLLAPVMPFVTEEVWSWWHEGSVHLSSWPAAAELPAGGDPAVLAAARTVLSETRRIKAARKLSLRAPLGVVVVRAAEADLDRVRAASDDVRAAGTIDQLVLAGDPKAQQITVVAPDRRGR